MAALQTMIICLIVCFKVQLSSQSQEMKLMKMMEQLHNKIDQMSTRMDEMGTRMDTRIDNIESWIEDQKIGKLEESVEEIRSTQHVMSTKLSKMRNVTYPSAFHVRRTSALTTTPPINIEFDQVIYEIGGIWNIQSSSFLAPVKGVYVFYVSLMSGSSTGTKQAAIMVNGNIKQTGYATSFAYRTYSFSAIIELEYLDQVYCRLLADTLYTLGGGTNSNNHFIGYLLYQLD